MKKHLIAAAVAGAFAVPAMAQVTVSGVLDLGVGTQETTATGSAVFKNSNTGVSSRSTTSQIVFRAAEDLGGGLKASGYLSQQVNTSGGVTDGALSKRDMWLALEGGFGEIKVGRFTPAFETVSGSYSVTGTTNSAGTADFFFGAGAASGTAAGPRSRFHDVGRGIASDQAGATTTNDSSIQYTLPAFGPVKVILGYANHSTDTFATTGKDENNQLDLAVTYTAGPLSFGLGIADKSIKLENSTSTRDVELQSVGASYNLGAALVKVGYMMREQKVSTATTNEVDAEVMSVGVTVPLGATSIYANLLDGEDKADGVAANKRDFEGFQIGALYNLSKRTTAYFIMGENEYKGSTRATTSKVEQMTLGLRHSF